MAETSPSAPLIRGPYSGRDLAAFELPASDGRSIRLWDYRLRRNPVMFFHHGAGCPRCRGELARIARYYRQYRERDGEVLAIGPDAPAVAAALAADLELPFALLSDPDGRVARRQRVGVPAVIVANRVEEIWAAWSPNDELDLPSQEEILGWLEFVVLQCHNGCGRPDWGSDALNRPSE
jgi:peroxiredoxin